MVAADMSCSASSLDERVGAFGTLKQRILNVFLASQTMDGELFKKYGWRIAEDRCESVACVVELSYILSIQDADH